MTDPDPDILSKLAARIADGVEVTWPDAGGAGQSGDAALVEQFKAIAQVAAAHRASWADGDVPDTWAGLSIIEKIGEGRFGTVYRAVDPRLQRQVALKLLHAPASSDQSAPLAAIDEARLLARIHHPNVVTIHGAECIDGRVGIWTEFIEGRTLEAILRERGPLAPDDVAAIGVEVCRALGVMHAAGLVHRDVKAQNIMRDASGRVVLVDFGTAHDAARRSGVAAPAGTPLYMAPELFDGGQPSVASDIYAVAVLLYRLLTGGYPVDGDSTNAIKAAHAEGRRVSRRDAGVEAPAALGSAIERGLAPDPKDRFRDVHQFADALQPRRRRSRAWLTAGLAATVAVMLSLWAWNNARSASDVPELLCRDCITLGRMSVAVDGRTAVVEDYDSGDLLLRDLTWGSVQRLLAKAGSWDDSQDVAESPVLSRDGRLVAYRWVSHDRPGKELRVMPLRRGSRPTVSAAVSASLSPRDWRPDNKAVLVTRQPGVGWQLAWIGVDDRVVTPIRSFPEAPDDPVLYARVSPDGRQIVYGLRHNPREIHLFLIDADGSHDRSLVTTAAANVEPVWTADGRRVIYSSNVSGTVDLWSIPVAPKGTAVLVRQNIGRHSALTLTSDGRYISAVDLPDVPMTFVTPVSSSLQKTTPPLDIVGSNPSWSPDGRHLAVIRKSPAEGFDVVVRTIEDQSERLYTHSELRPQAWWADITHSQLRPQAWWADNDSLLVPADAGPRQWSAYRLNRASGAFEHALAPSSSTFRAAVGAVAPDGGTLYVGGRDASDDAGRTSRLIAIDLSTGAEKAIAPLPPSSIGGGRLGLAASPAGRSVAAFVQIGGESFIRLVDLERRESRPLVGPFPAFSAFGKISWTRDDTIWYGESLPSETGRPGWRIMRVSASGGVPEVVIPRINGPMVGEARFAVSPDSSRIAWTALPGVPQSVSALAMPRSQVWSTDLRNTLAHLR